MEANIWGFNVQSQPCEFGNCNPTCQNNAGAEEYGPGDSYTINSYKPYHVRTQFMVRNYDERDLEEIRTTITQGDNKIVIRQNCPDVLADLGWKLKFQLHVGISTYALPLDNDVGGYCEAACTGGNLYIANLKFAEGDSYYTDEDLEEALADTTEYKFGGKCRNNDDSSECHSEGHCFRSWPVDDERRWNSDDAKCRTIPDHYINNEFEYSRNPTRNQNAGLCSVGCAHGEQCYNSWIA